VILCNFNFIGSSVKHLPLTFLEKHKTNSKTTNKNN